MNSTHVATTIREIRQVSDLAPVLFTLAELDADFSGENGEEYKWEVAQKYESNADYTIEYALDIPFVEGKGITAFTEKFCEIWSKHEGYYDSIEILVEKLNGEATDDDIKGIYAFTLILTDHN